MMTVELIWGNKALSELREPHSDPKVSKLEADVEEAVSRLYFARALDYLALPSVFERRCK